MSLFSHSPYPSVLPASPGSRFVAFLMGTVLLCALYAGTAIGSTREVAKPTDAASCAQMVGDTNELLEETEVSAETDQQVETLIATANSHCTAAAYDDAFAALMQARKLLGS